MEQRLIGVGQNGSEKVDASETKEVPCGCGGRSSNCPTCFGLGYFVRHQATYFVSTRPTKLKAVDNPYNVIELFAHLIEKPMQGDQQVKRIGFFTDYRICSYCGQRMHMSSLKQHIKKMHTHSTKSVKHKSGAVASSQAGKSLRCPTCDVEIKTKNRVSHLRRVHGLNDLVPTPSQISTQSDKEIMAAVSKDTNKVSTGAASTLRSKPIDAVRTKHVLDTVHMDFPTNSPLDQHLPNELASPFPFRWTNDQMNRSVLRWFVTGDGGFGMPLPEAGEFLLRPSPAGWILSGESFGVRLPVSSFNTLQAAFEYLDSNLECLAPILVAEIAAEDRWDDPTPTPILISLMRNLRDLINSEKVNIVRSKAETALHDLYEKEYNPRAERSSESDY